MPSALRGYFFIFFIIRQEDYYHHELITMTKIYVVWEGRNPGIYDTWEECKAQVDGYKGAKFKSFKKLEEATEAFALGHSAVTEQTSVVILNGEIYLEDCPEEILPGWKPSKDYPEKVQTILQKIKDNSIGSR